MSFLTDLANGQDAENQVIQYLVGTNEVMNTICPVETTQDKGKFEDYDFKFAGLFFEVKNDRKSSKTGNLAFEFKNSRTNKPSGIKSSKADFIVYMIEDNMIFFNRLDLLQDLRDTTEGNRRIIHRVGDGNSSIIVVKLDYIKQNFGSIKHVHNTVVQEVAKTSVFNGLGC